MGRGKVATDFQRLKIATLVAAASPEDVTQMEVFARAGELARISKIRWDRQYSHLNEIEEGEDSPWASPKEQIRLREEVSPLLSLAMWNGQDSAWSWATKHATATTAAEAVRDDTADPRRRRANQIKMAAMEACKDCMSLAAEFLPQGMQATEGILPILGAGLVDGMDQFMRGRLFTFECSACHEVGFRIGRHGLTKKSRYCCVRCDRNPHPASTRSGRPAKLWLQPWEPGPLD